MENRLQADRRETVTILCRLDEISDPGGKGFVFGEGTARREIFVMRKGGRVWGYVNRCPHAGIPLDWQPDQFLDPSKTLIQCATHGALFGIEDGLCVAGPCKGKALAPVAVRIATSDLECPAVVWDEAG
jgi:nitrite reductase/ring-hydroxylating ferredoxin subunit